MRKWCIGLLLGLSSCSYFIPSPPCPPPFSAKDPITPTTSCESLTVPPIVPESQQCLSLADLIDIALQNSPETRQTWFNAKVGAAVLGVARGAYLPSINFQGEVRRDQFLNAQCDIGGEIRQNTFSATLNTNYLLLDFGARSGTVCAAANALEALNWTYNWQVQTILLNVIKNYYNFISAKESVAINESFVKDSEQTLAATEKNKDKSENNSADILQARTNLLQAKINLETAKATFYSAQISLSLALKIPPESCYCVEDLPEEFDVQEACIGIEAILAFVKSNRADLEAARSVVRQKRAGILVARSNFWPTISTQLMGGEERLESVGAPCANGDFTGKIFTTALRLDYGLFNSFSDVNNILRAEAEWQAAQAALDLQEASAFAVALSDYYQFMVYNVILKYSQEALEVAKQNYGTALTNYEGDKGSIIETLNALDALNVARQQLVTARINWLTSIANLSYDTGGIAVCGVDDSGKVILPEYDALYESLSD